MNPSPTHAAARAAIARRWHVFPLAYGRKSPARWMTDWEKRATTDPRAVANWWGRSARNLAIATGPSRLVVVDLDTRKPDQEPPADHPEWDRHASGLGVIRDLAAERGAPLPATYTVRTASGGWHLYYRAPAGAELRNTCGRIGWLIDTRAAGGYVVGAGSVVNGRPYTVVRDVAELPELPDWLIALSAPPKPAPARRPPEGLVASFQSYAGAAFAGELTRVHAAQVGERNRALNKAAWNLSKFIAASHLDRTTVEHELQHAAEATGLRPTEAAATIRSAINAGLRHHLGAAS